MTLDVTDAGQIKRARIALYDPASKVLAESWRGATGQGLGAYAALVQAPAAA